MNGATALEEYDRLLQSLEDDTRRDAVQLTHRQSAPKIGGREYGESASNESVSGAHLQVHGQNTSLVPTRPQANESRKRKHSSFTLAVNDVPSANRTWPPLSPVTVLDATGWDPFNSFPHHADSHSHRLIHLYLNADLIPGLQQAQSAPLKESLVSIRKNQVFPVVLHSTAAYGALVSYVETTPGLPMKSHNDLFVRWHLNVALSHANMELLDPAKLGTDGLRMTVCLLMIVALRMDDLDTFRAHGHGLLALLSQRQRSSAGEIYGDQRGTGGHDSSTTPAGHSSSGVRSCTLSIQSNKPGSNKISSEGSSFPGTSVIPYSLLLRNGLISSTFVHQLQYQALLNMLIRPAKHDSVLRTGIQQHIFTDSVSAMYTGATTPFEVAVFSANRLFQHLTAWSALKLHPSSFYWWTAQRQSPNPPTTEDHRKRNPQCVVASRPVSGIRQMLIQSDLDELFYHCPIVLVWIALLAGPASQALTRRWFAWLLKKAWGIARRSMPMLSSFRATVRFFEQEFAWGSELNLAAEVFWVGVLFSRPNPSDAQPSSSIGSFDPLSRAHAIHSQNFDDQQEFIVAQDLLQNLLSVYNATDASLPYTSVPSSAPGTTDEAEAAMVHLLVTIRKYLSSTIHDTHEPPCILHAKCPGHTCYEL